MKKKGIVLFLLSALLFTACGTEKNKTEETDKLTVPILRLMSRPMMPIPARLGPISSPSRV